MVAIEKKGISMNYKVKIDNPCDQSWQEMTEVQGGKFCKHCCKTVTDFTHLGDQEVIKLIKQSSGNLCGRFTDEQLNKEFKEDKEKNNNWHSKIAASLLLLIASKSVSANTKASKIFITNDYGYLLKVSSKIKYNLYR